MFRTRKELIDKLMKTRVVEIGEGWYNLIRASANTLSDEQLKLSRRRYEICHSCEYRKNVICGKCGCPLSMKTKSTRSKCPVGKW